MTETVAVVESPSVAPSVAHRDLRLVAENPGQLATEQGRLIEWCRSKIADLRAHAAELQSNLDAARAHKWKTSTLASAVGREKGRVSYYEKMLAALEAGYFIVPNFDAEVFAVRTARSTPDYATAEDTKPNPRPRVLDVQTPVAAVGDGNYVSNRPLVERDEYTAERYGKPVEILSLATVAFNREIDFPFALAKPQVMSATQAAMALKIFDDVAVLPRSQRTNSDPMVVGIIRRKEGYTVKRCTFLIAWFLDTDTL